MIVLPTVAQALTLSLYLCAHVLQVSAIDWGTNQRSTNGFIGRKLGDVGIVQWGTPEETAAADPTNYVPMPTSLQSIAGLQLYSTEDSYAALDASDGTLTVWGSLDAGAGQVRA